MKWRRRGASCQSNEDAVRCERTESSGGDGDDACVKTQSVEGMSVRDEEGGEKEEEEGACEPSSMVMTNTATEEEEDVEHGADDEDKEEENEEEEEEEEEEEVTVEEDTTDDKRGDGQGQEEEGRGSHERREGSEEEKEEEEEGAHSAPEKTETERGGGGGGGGEARVEDRMKRYYYSLFSTSYHRLARAFSSLPYVGQSALHVRPLLESGETVYVLGSTYSARAPQGETTTTTTIEEQGDVEAEDETKAHMQYEIERLTADLCSRPWVTYRTNFERLAESDFSSDVGWGCALRSGQMMLAQFLFKHRLGREWRRGDAESWGEAKSLLKRFRDVPDDSCTFSIHNIVSCGREHGVSPGNWLGPYVLCQSIATLFRRFLWDEMRAFVVTPGSGGAPTLFIDNVKQLCALTTESQADDNENDDGGGEWMPVIILVPLVLGPFRHINPTYVKSLMATFGFPQSLGIVGGRTNASHYFVGCYGDSVLYMDPHTVQAAVADNDTAVSDEEAASYFCTDVRSMKATAMSPSLAVAFYCKCEHDFDDLVARLRKLESESGCAPLLTVADREPPIRDDSVDEEWDDDEGRSGTGNEWQIV